MKRMNLLIEGSGKKDPASPVGMYLEVLGFLGSSVKIINLSKS